MGHPRCFQEPAIDASKVFKHHEYELVCGAKPVNNGRFAPTLTVCKQVWPTRPREIAVPRGDYTTEQTAIDAAYAQGLEWIQNYGDPAPLRR
jgi:hypothetical protein